MFLHVSALGFFAKAHCAALPSDRKKIKINSRDIGVDKSPGPTLPLVFQGIRWVVDFCLLRVQNHELHHQNNWCTGLDVLKTGPHPAGQRNMSLTSTYESSH